MTTTSLRSRLAAWQADATTPEQLKQRGWREQHILVVAIGDDRLDAYEQAFLRRLGQRLYGREVPHG